MKKSFETPVLMHCKRPPGKSMATSLRFPVLILRASCLLNSAYLTRCDKELIHLVWTAAVWPAAGLHLVKVMIAHLRRDESASILVLYNSTWVVFKLTLMIC